MTGNVLRLGGIIGVACARPSYTWITLKNYSHASLPLPKLPEADSIMEYLSFHSFYDHSLLGLCFPVPGRQAIYLRRYNNV